IAGAGGVGESVGGVEDSAVRRADDLLLARIIIDGDTCMSAGALAGDEVAVCQADQQAALTIGRVGKFDRAIIGHVGISNNGACMRWSRSWRWLRRLWRRLLGWLLRRLGRWRRPGFLSRRGMSSRRLCRRGGFLRAGTGSGRGCWRVARRGRRGAGF